MKIIRKNLKVFLILLAMIISNVSFAQEVSISGRVTDQESGEPLPGVTIVVKGTTIGTITDFDGMYTLDVESGAILQYSYIGYEAAERIAGDQTTLNVALALDTEQLGEVVVIGYGQVKKEDATGSVSAVSSEDFNPGAMTSPQELIQGKSAGVVITSSDGSPSGSPQIRIRGGSSLFATNDPLIVIDGFPVNNREVGGLANVLSTLNPHDIENMTVLKDASSTAIYGSRASNGVIIITTKKGQAGRPFKISYNGNTSISKATETLEVLTGDEMRDVVQERVSSGALTDFALTRLGNENTDWQDEIYRTAVSMDHNISITGSYKDVPYRASLGYTDQNGILDQSNLQRTTLDLSLNPSFFDKHLNVNANVKAIDINNDFSNTDAIGSAVEMDPTQPIMNGNSRYGGYFAWTNIGEDPLNGDPINIATHNPLARIAYRDNTSDVQRLFGNLQLDYKFHFLPELKVNLNMGYDYTKSEGHDITDLKASWSLREPKQNVKTYENIAESSLFDLYFNYKRDIESIASNVDVTAGYSWQHFEFDYTNTNRAHEDAEADANVSIDKNEYYLVSFFGRLNYSLLDKYLVTFTVRNDGSSRFADGNRWGLFPSAALGWKVNKEAFLENVSEINELKLRLGWGITGQQDISGDFYPYLARYTGSEVGASYQFGDTFYNTQRPERYDANIQWEETTTYNIGLDFGLFDNRITGSFEYYQRETKDLISEIPIAAGTNFSNFLITNVGSLENNGFEAQITGRPITTKDWSWEITGTFSYNENEITKLTRVDDPNFKGNKAGDAIAGGVDNKVLQDAVGQPFHSFYLFNQVYDINGMPIEGLYIDHTGQGGAVDGNDNNKRFNGSPAADYLIGVSSRVNYKNWDFSFNARISIGNYVYNNNASNRALYQNLYNQSGYAANILSAIEETKFATAQYFSDFYLEDASFLRMDNINLGYSFDKLFTEKLSGRVGLTVQNAFVITNYSGLDPEVSSGIDNNLYPRPRTFILGVNIDF